MTRTTDGGTQRVGFFGTNGALFGCTHVPPGDPLGGLLICSPLHVELGKNYGREIVLARTLAAQGIVVQRFHYRGTGHSAGDGTEFTFDSLVEDALVAVRQIEAQIGDRPLAFLGTRLGAFVAAVAAGRRPGSPVILWEPSGSARQHFRTVLRAGIIRGLKSGDAADAPGQFSLDRLQAQSLIDVLGYPVTWPLYKSLVDRSIATELGDGPRPVQVVQFGGRPPGRPDLLALTDQLRQRGATVSLDVLGADEAWWFGGAAGDASSESRTTAQPLAVLSSRWLTECLAHAVGQVAP